MSAGEAGARAAHRILRTEPALWILRTRPARIARGLTAPPPVPCYGYLCHRPVTVASLEPQNQNSMPRCA
jgi:hypothetical protein